MTADWSALWLGLQAAALSTAIAVVLGPWLAYRWKPWAGIWLAWLPLSLSPALLFGYCLLAADFGRLPAGLVASAFSLPYMMRASAAAYGLLDPQYFNAARGLGASEWRIFRRIAGPLALRPILAAAAFAFASVTTDCAVALMLARALRTGGRLPGAALAATGALSLAIHSLGTRLERGAAEP